LYFFYYILGSGYILSLSIKFSPQKFGKHIFYLLFGGHPQTTKHCFYELWYICYCEQVEWVYQF